MSNHAQKAASTKNPTLSYAAVDAMSLNDEQLARLIVAAPDLLAACETALSHLMGADGTPQAEGKLRATLRAAIAKATGIDGYAEIYS